MTKAPKIHPHTKQIKIKFHNYNMSLQDYEHFMLSPLMNKLWLSLPNLYLMRLWPVQSDCRLAIHNNNISKQGSVMKSGIHPLFPLQWHHSSYFAVLF